MEPSNDRRSEASNQPGVKAKGASFSRVKHADHGSLIHMIVNPVISFILIIAALFLSDYSFKLRSRQNANEDLIASARNQSAILEAIWDGQADTLHTTAIGLAEYDTIDQASAMARMQRLSDETDFNFVAFALADGICRFNETSTVDISSRAYFQQAMAGNTTLQRIQHSLESDEVMIMLAVPIVKDARVIGAVLGGYTEKQLADLIAPVIYEGQAFSIICREDGFITVGSESPHCKVSSNNLFYFIEVNQIGKEISVEQLRRDIASGKTGTATYHIDGEKRYAAYVPLKRYAASGERLVMFNIVPAELIDASAKRQSLINTLLFGLILAATTLTFLSYLFSAMKSRKRLTHERDQLRASEEEIRIAIESGGLLLARYDLKTRMYHNKSDILHKQGFGEEIENVPQAFIDANLVAPESIDDFRAFYDNLCAGKSGTLFARLKTPDGTFRWFRKDATFVLDANGQPYQAIVRYRDITDEREQAAVYERWKRSIEERDPNSYTLFRSNLSKNASFDSMEGSLLNICFKPGLSSFNERTMEYAGRFVHMDDFDAYVQLLNSENLLASYYRGARAATLDYRERVTEGEYRWLRVSVEMMQYTDSTDIEAFLMYENIDAAKLEELSVKERIDADSLTGTLNRAAFIERFTALITKDQPDAQHALILVDIDGFRRLNDNFGHAVGDQALIDIAASLRSAMREEDMLSRLGGDEFLICMTNVANQTIVEQKAVQIQALLRKAFSVDVRISASMGVAFYPADGKDFNTLYYCVDLALFTAKSNGRDAFAIYNGESMKSARSDAAVASASGVRKPPKRSLLVVSDNADTLALIRSQFGEEYILHTCADEHNALACLHRYGLSISAVLLSLDIASLDSLALLDRLSGMLGVKSIPVIALSKLDERARSLRALQHGACDFLLEPIDPTLLGIRVQSAVSKAENERLRAQNTFLQTQSNEGSNFRTVFAHTGTVVVEYDCQSGVFSYDPSISEHILGKYDDRSFWRILMSDMVADVMDVKAMQTLVLELSSNRRSTSATLDVRLKTPSKAKHWFTMNAFKRVDDRNMPSKIILTFLDVNDDVLASKKLRFQAEHGILTGLYNRSSFLRLVEETVRTKPVNAYVLLCCDINDFRFVNERFGREEGDKLLQYSAERLLVYSDAMNGFTGRLSNDVYAMLLPNDPGILEKAVDIIRDFYKDYPLKARITCRAGAYIIADPTMKADSMLDLASTASAAIKGKFNAFLAVYDESMNEKRVQEKAVTDHMEAALAEGQFVVYIQPQFHHATGQLVGGEALVRWIDPQKGVIPPASFIPIFEKNGFITQLDEYVWNRTAQYLSEWIAQGHKPVPISVNVSREDTKDPELCQKLLAIVKKYDLPVNLFRLEITESLFAQDTERLIAVVEQLHESGFLIEMDDFGSGYSSLNILKDVPVDILKLDMKFFAGEDNLGRGGMIINAVLRMSRWLNIPVIAEGVEHKNQADFLLSIGCPTIQGYLYERPMPASDFERGFLQNHAAKTFPQNPVKTMLDEHDFWNPLSTDSQIFNNYIGPAAIFEYHNGEYEIVRMNRRFIETVHIHENSMVPSAGLVHFVDADKPVFEKAVLEAIDSQEDVKLAVHCLLEDGSQPLFHITLRVIAKSAERALLFGALNA